jgi:hypothetical protein
MIQLQRIYRIKDTDMRMLSVVGWSCHVMFWNVSLVCTWEAREWEEGEVWTINPYWDSNLLKQDYRNS